MGLSLQTVGDAVNAKRAWLSTLEVYPSRIASKALRKRLCAFYGANSYATLAKDIDTAKLARALLDNLSGKRN